MTLLLDEIAMAAARLAEAGVDSPRTDAEVIAAYVHGVPRTELHLVPDADFELGVPEVGEAGDVLERLAGLPAGDLVPEPRLEAGVGHQVQLRPGHAVHVRGDHFGVGAR